jgi:hypothetical protein
MRCGGIHCDGCRHGSGGSGPLALIALFVIIVAAGIKSHGHQIADVLIIGGWSLFAVSVAGGAGLIAWRIRRRVLAERDRRIPPRVQAVITDARAGRPVGEATRRKLRDARPGLPGGQKRPSGRQPELLCPLPDDVWSLLEGLPGGSQEGER